jgi:hypothetical protein
MVLVKFMSLMKDSCLLLCLVPLAFDPVTHKYSSLGDLFDKIILKGNEDKTI